MPSEPTPATERRASDGRDLAIAGVCAAVALAVYVRTLAPGLTSDLDTPLFQFIGRALGVAHNPGYPLYTLATWPIAQVPIGELAWRINLFSAVMGAIATALVYLGARCLGARALAAAAAALGFATGATFWSQAVIAEVYTLHAALVAGLLLAAFTWSRSRRPAHFYAALGCLAAGLGHHTTILAFAPGLVVAALLADRRFLFRARTVATSAAILAIGLLPYGLILVRSRDPQAYVESRATTLRELAGVVLGGQFQDRLFGPQWRALAAVQGPLLWERVFVGDVTWVGLGFAAVGAAWLLRQRPGDALLIASGGAAVTAFAVGYAVPDVPVFVIPALLGLWLFAAVGGEQALRAAARLLPGPAIGPAQAVLAVALVALPVWLGWRHAARVDRSGDRLDALQVDRLFETLPPRAAIVSGDFIADRMLQYEQRGRDLPRAREIRIGPRDGMALRALLGSEAPVVAFAPAVERLRFEGLDFSATPLRLPEGPFAEFVARLPRGASLALAVPAEHAGRFAPVAEPARRRLGAGVPSTRRCFALVAVVGDATPARIADGIGEARLTLPAGAGVWGHGRSELEVMAETGTAAIRLGGRDLVRTTEGIAVAAWGADGRLLRVFVLEAAAGYLVPLPAGAFSAYPLIDASDGQLLASNAWLDVTPETRSGSVTVRVPAGARLELEASDDAPLAPAVIEHAGRGPVTVAAVDTPSGGRAYTSRIAVDASQGTPVSLFLTLGGIPARAVARIVSSGAQAGSLRGVATAGLLKGLDRRSAVIAMTRDDQTRLIGHGWSNVETDDGGPCRWTTAPEARLVLPPSASAWRTLTVEAFRPPGAAVSTLGLRVHGEVLPAQPVRDGWQRYSWPVPPAVAAALQRTASELSLLVDGPTTGRGLAIASIRFSEAP